MSEEQLHPEAHPYDHAHRFPDGDGGSQDVDWGERLGDNLDGWISAETSDIEVGDERWTFVVGGGGAGHGLGAVCVGAGEWLAEHELDDELAELDNPDDWSAEEVDELDGDDLANYKRAVLLTSASEAWRKAQETDGMAEGPMMNYWYVLENNRFGDEIDRAYSMATKLAGLPLCVVLLDDAIGLALTGGGMDLSWEIAEAHLRLGYSVPSWIDLPLMVDRGESEDDQAIIRGVVRTQQRRVLRAQSGLALVTERFRVDLTDPRVEA